VTVALLMFSGGQFRADGSRGVTMKNRALLAVSFSLLLLAAPVFGGSKKHGERAMIERMEAVPCGAKERGLAGLGALWGSVGATHVDSDQKLCPQYLLRTDEMEYHIRPLDHKHPVLLPVGQEGEIKIDKSVMEVRVPDGDRKKRLYQVVAMKPLDHSGSSDAEGASSKYDKDSQPNGYADKSLANQNPRR